METTNEPRVSLADQAYERVFRAIMSCEVAPGDMLTVEDVAQRLGMSGSPVQQALKRLAERGLVIIKPHTGHFVSPVSLEDLKQVFELRLSLESVSVQLGLRRGSDEQLESLGSVITPDPHRGMDEPWDPELRSALPQLYPLISGVMNHNDFHLAVASLSGNPRLVSAIDNLLTDTMRATMLYFLKNPALWSEFKVPPPPDVRDQHHAEIVEAMQARKLEPAVQAMREHLVQGFDQLKTIFEPEEGKNTVWT